MLSARLRNPSYPTDTSSSYYFIYIERIASFVRTKLTQLFWEKEKRNSNIQSLRIFKVHKSYRRIAFANILLFHFINYISILYLFHLFCVYEHIFIISILFFLSLFICDFILYNIYYIYKAFPVKHIIIIFKKIIYRRIIISIRYLKC